MKYCQNNVGDAKEHDCEDDCQANCDKSSGAIEAAGGAAMFNCSIKQNKLTYYEYLGDGYTSSFK